MAQNLALEVKYKQLKQVPAVFLVLVKKVQKSKRINSRVAVFGLLSNLK